MVILKPDILAVVVVVVAVALVQMAHIQVGVGMAATVVLEAIPTLQEQEVITLAAVAVLGGLAAHLEPMLTVAEREEITALLEPQDNLAWAAAAVAAEHLEVLAVKALLLFDGDSNNGLLCRT